MEIDTINCVLSEPVEESPDADFEFSKMDCSVSYSATSTLPVHLEKIISEDEQKEFFLEKTISYGDFLIVSFFILLVLGLAVSGIRDFVKNRKLERL